jgi:hypothetical protein
LADLLLADLTAELPRLQRQDQPQRGSEASSFSHGAGPNTPSPVAQKAPAASPGR